MLRDFDSFYGAIQDAVVILKDDDICVYGNKKFSQLYNCASEEVENKSVDLRDFAGWCCALSSTNESTPHKFRVENKSAEEGCVEWSVSPLDETHTLYIGRALEEAQLNESDADASDGADAKMRFLATMTHEMRTPLNGILGMAGLLMDGDLQPSERSYVEAIRDSGTGLLTLVNDILDLSKAVSGKIELEKFPFNLRTTVEGVFELLSAKVLQKEIEVTSFIHPEVPVHLLGDEGRLRQILLNLVGNAVKFTETGGVILEVFPGEKKPDGEIEIRFAVKDTGIGIPSHKLESIFEEFTQADSSIARKYEGTGLGLAIARRIVNAMQGDISVESELNVGSTFSFAITAAVNPDKPVSVPQVRTDKTVVCLVRSETLRHVFDLYLGSLGVTNYVITDSVEECTAALEKHQNTCFVCDVTFATLHGHKLTQKASRSVILLTPSTRGRLDTFRKIGFEAYLIKPIRQASLVERLSDGGQVAVASQSNDNSQTAAHTDKSSLNILLAEDNQINALLAKSVLGNAGHKVTHVENGQLALDKLEVASFDIFLVDMRMPVLDGIEAMRQVRASAGAYKHIPMIALTANSTKQEIETCYEVGANDFISKPFEPQDLLTRIAKCVSEAALPAAEKPAVNS
jgi:signal transduction histidine kinase/DNA-binding response OmpR family regulator